MFEKINEAAADLANTKAGWVTRRDGAGNLGKAAAKALASLNGFKDDPDRDVRATVLEALGVASASLAGIKPAPGTMGEMPLKELVAGCEKPGKRDVQENEKGYLVTVTFESGRKQFVQVSRIEEKGLGMVLVETDCGKASEDAYAWALRANVKLRQGALALREVDGEEHLVAMNSYIASEATPKEIKAAVKELSFYADWIEQKLSGTDVY